MAPDVAQSGIKTSFFPGKGKQVELLNLGNRLRIHWPETSPQFHLLFIRLADISNVVQLTASFGFHNFSPNTADFQ